MAAKRLSNGRSPAGDDVQPLSSRPHEDPDFWAIYIGDNDDNVYDGTEDADTVYAQGGNDIIRSLGGDDELYGRDGNDQLYGGNDNDTLFGGNGSDLLDGGGGNDILMVHMSEDKDGLSAGDQFVGGSGFDTLFFKSSNFDTLDIRTLSVAADIESIKSEGCFVQLTRAQFLQFQKYEGAFYISGSGAFDLTGGQLVSGLLKFDSGDDSLTLAGLLPNTSQSSFSVFAGGGDDQIIASESNDLISGEDGNDRLEGRGGNDGLDGGAGDDILLGGDGNDDLRGGGGVDSYDGGIGNDVIHLNFADGSIAGEAISGGSGTDTLSVLGFGTVDLEAGLVADDFEIFQGGQTSVKASATRLGHFQYFEASSLTITTGGSLTMTSNFKVREVFCSAAGNNVDFTQSTVGNCYGIGGSGTDTLTGSASADVLSGNGGNDVIHGGGSNDELNGGAGMDWVDGGEGNDTIIIAKGEGVTAGDRFTGGAGFDTLSIGGDFNGPVVITDFTSAIIDADIESLDSIAEVGARLTTAQLNQFSRIHINTVELSTGGSVDFTGRDMQLGSLYLSAAGNIVRLQDYPTTNVYGAAGDDIVYCGAGGAFVRGGGGSDVLIGGMVRDDLYGDDGTDSLNGGGGADYMVGGLGNDTFIVDNAGELVMEAANQGYDVAFTSVSYTLLAGQEIEGLVAYDFNSTAALNLTGNEYNNYLIGNAGANILGGGTGADLMEGRLGNDIYIIDNSGDAIIEAANQGYDVAYVSVNYVMAPGWEVEGLVALDFNSTYSLDLTGNELDNYLIANAGANALRGGTGNDILEGRNGDDYLDGGTGADTLYGGLGNDTYIIDNAGDNIVDLVGEGYDVAFVSVSYTLTAGASIEGLVAYDFNSTVALNFTGNELDNYLIGNAGNNQMNGSTGADLMEGRLGNDIYIIDNSGDAIIEAANQGYDVAYVSVNYVMAPGWEVEGLVALDFNSTYSLNLTGNELNNYIIANAGANLLNGGAGSDTLEGRDGNDTLDGGSGADFLFGGQGDDTYYVDNAGDQLFEANGGGDDRVFTSVSYTLAAGTWIDTLFASAGTAAMNLTGNELANHLTGNDGNNVLCGGLGQDILYGGPGADSFLFNVQLGLADADGLLDFTSGVDKILLDHNIFTGLALGALSASAFKDGTGVDADDRIIYSNEFLYFDADGSGPGQAVIFATTAGLVPVNAFDFVVV